MMFLFLTVFTMHKDGSSSGAVTYKAHFLVISVKINFYFLYNFAGRNFIRGYSTKRITTHYSVVPRETDPRWEGEC